MSARSATDSRSSSASSSRRSRSALLLTPPLNLTLYGAPAPRASRPSPQQQHQHQRRLGQRRASGDLRARSPPPAPRSSPAIGSGLGLGLGFESGAASPAFSAPLRFPHRDAYLPLAQGEKFKSGFEKRRSSNSSTPDYLRYSPMRVLPSATPELGDDEKNLLGYSTKRETFYCDITDTKETTPLPSTPMCSSPFERESTHLSYVSKKTYDYPQTSVKYVRGHSAIPTCRSGSVENYDGYLLSRTKSLPSVNNFGSCLSFEHDSFNGFDTEDYQSNSTIQQKDYTPSSNVQKYNTKVIDTPLEMNDISQYKNWSYNTDAKFNSSSTSDNMYDLEIHSENITKAITNNTTENDMLCLTEIRENFTNHCSSPLKEVDTITKAQKSLLFSDKISSDESDKKTYNPSDYNEYNTQHTQLSRNSHKDSQNKNTSHHVRFDVDSCEGMNSDDCKEAFDSDDKIYERDYEIQFRKLNIPPDQDNMLKTGDNYFKDMKCSPSKESTTDNASCSSVDNTCNSGLCIINDRIENDNSMSTSVLIFGSRGDILLKNLNENSFLEKGAIDNAGSLSNKDNKVCSTLCEVSDYLVQERNPSAVSSLPSVRESLLSNSESSLTSQKIRSTTEEEKSTLNIPKYNYTTDTKKQDSHANNVSNFKELIPSLDRGKTETNYKISSNYEYSTTSKGLLCENDFSHVSSFQDGNKSVSVTKLSNENNTALRASNYTSHIQRDCMRSPKIAEEALEHNLMLKSEIADREKTPAFSMLDTKYKDLFSDQERKLTNTYDKDDSISPVNSTNSKFTRVQCNHSNTPSPDLKLSLRELKDAARYARQLATVLENIIQKHSQPKCSSKECTSQQFEASYLSDVTWEEYSDEEWASQEKHSSVMLDNIPESLNSSPQAISNQHENKEQKEYEKEMNKRQSLPQEYPVRSMNYGQSRHQELILPVRTSTCSCPLNSENKILYDENSLKMIPVENEKGESNDFHKSSLEQLNSSKYLLNSCSSPSSDRCHCCGPTMLHLSPEMLRQQRASLKVASKVNEEKKKKNASMSLHQDVADAIRNAIELRREAILPSDDTTCATSRSMSEWSV